MNKRIIKMFFIITASFLAVSPALEAGVSFRVFVGGDRYKHQRVFYYNDRYCAPNNLSSYCHRPLRPDFRGHIFYDNGVYYYYSRNYYRNYYGGYYYYERRPYSRKSFGIYFGVPGFHSKGHWKRHDRYYHNKRYRNDRYYHQRHHHNRQYHRSKRRY